MGFTEEKQKKGASASAGASTKKESEYFQMRITIALKKRLEAVAELKGTTMKQLVDQVLGDYVSDEIRKVVDKSSKYKP